jgi:hypothetical protein
VDRRVEGEETWHTIVYRPRKNAGHADNAQHWRDFSAVSGIAYEYRVVAVNCDDDDQGALEADGPVKVITRVEEPVISPSGSFDAPVEAVLDCSTFGARIYYTLDGSDPTEKDALYEGPFWVDSSLVLKCRAYRDGITPSYVVESYFDIQDVTAIEEKSRDALFSLYPVPAADKLHVRLNRELSGEICFSVLSMEGRLISSKVTTHPLMDLVLSFPSDMPSGNYLFRMEYAEEVYSTLFSKE